MRIKLMEFQLAASTELIKNLHKMRRNYDEYGDLSATTLQAPTGAGKTVVSADVIETLFFGDNARGIEGDPRACVLWVSESPSLNAQTRNRFMTVSDRLADSIYDHRHVEIVGNDFCASHEELEKGRVYFVSKDLLGKNGLLTKGSESNNGRTFWYVLKRTIEDTERHLYLFIDEAHRGLGENKSSTQGTPTIYANLIDGVPGESVPMPVVVGVSATPKRFEEAMRTRPDRDLVSTVAVPPSAVQASGLLKDTIVLGVPKAEDQVEHRYLVMACERLAMARQAWDAYCTAQQEERVVPLLIVQVRDGISDAELKGLCQQIRHELPDLDPSMSFAHVFGTHTAIYAKPYTIPYVEPENVSDMKEIQVLFAKEAVSNGWDCPRAEVLLSYRRRNQEAYITQLIGRMVRNPLARRIEADETLNSVAVYLPDFDPETVNVVIDYLTGERDDLSVPPVSEVLREPVRICPATPRTQEQYEEERADYERRVAEEQAAWEGRPGATLHLETDDGSGDVAAADEGTRSVSDSGCDGELAAGVDAQGQTSQAIPSATTGPSARVAPGVALIPKPAPLTKRDSSFTAEDMAAIRDVWRGIIVERVPWGHGTGRNPFNSLLDVATLMMNAGWEPTAGRDVREAFCDHVDGAIVTHKAEYERALDGVMHAETQLIEIEGVVEGRVSQRRDVRPKADARDIEIEASVAFRVFGGKELVNAYRRRCRMEAGMSAVETNLRVASIARVPAIIQDLQDWAKKTRDGYLEGHHGDVAYASEALRQEYDRLQGESGYTQVRHPEWPSARDVSTVAEDGSGFARYPKHILQDADGLCPLDLNQMEQDVVCREMLRNNAVAFYRNPGGARTPAAFSITYSSATSNSAACHPDFVFFMRMADGTVRASIVDPHTTKVGDDALPKLKGYVRYLHKYPDVFVQVLSVSDVRGTGEYRSIDLRDKGTQEAIMSWSGDTAEALYLKEGISHHYGDKSEVPGLLDRFGVVCG